MTAVAAEAVSRFLFFELAHDPELLARLVVLYFEKGSAADPAAARGGEKAGEGEADEEEAADDEEDAKAVGSSVRLSQVNRRSASMLLRDERARGVCIVFVSIGRANQLTNEVCLCVLCLCVRVCVKQALSSLVLQSIGLLYRLSVPAPYTCTHAFTSRARAGMEAVGQKEATRLLAIRCRIVVSPPAFC